MSTRKAVGAKGFTLVELLTVMAVIAVLAAILFTVFARVRESGRRSVCQNNLKQIALAVQQYMQDGDGRFPLWLYHRNTNNLFGWNNALSPYIKNPAVFRCPSAPRKGIPDGDYGYNWARLNNFIWKPLGTPVLNQADTVHEAYTPATSSIWLNADHTWLDNEEVISLEQLVQSSCGRQFIGGISHSSGANYSFLDGHVKWLTPRQMAEIDCQNAPLSLPGGQIPVP
ncbi:MAG TPA: prepilin-type N-terminal cleavage/methylation domain-containing protein [Abditibacteriaceae bacterium]|jgi:prepilin-type N-terminal cleavage/methylation domain-containing protein/prepilin-type processing-associated H-X9-DG protein